MGLPAYRTQPQDFFGGDKELASITSADADDFRAWLETTEELSEAMLRKRCSVARQFFRRAVKARIIDENPFGEMKNISVGSSPEERMFFLEAGDFDKVVQAISLKQIDLRTVFALSRWGGFRCPSEPATLKWGHIDWKKGRMTVPLTCSLQKSPRCCGRLEEQTPDRLRRVSALLFLPEPLESLHTSEALSN